VFANKICGAADLSVSERLWRAWHWVILVGVTAEVAGVVRSFT
jgi:hypothetical protein